MEYPRREREIEFDGVIYVFRYHNDYTCRNNAHDFLGGMEEKERHEIKRKMIERLLEVGYLIRKGDLKKRNSIYKEDELFYGL
jgi:hypothetical protein